MFCGKYQNEKKMKRVSRFGQSRPQILLEGVISISLSIVTDYAALQMSLFSRVHATLHPALSVRRSVGPSVRRSVGPSVRPSVRPSHFTFL